MRVQTSSPCVLTKRIRCHPRTSVGGLEWGRGRLSIFSELHLDSPRLWLGSSAAQLQRRWAGGGGSSLPGLPRDSVSPNLTPQPPPGQLLQSIRRGSSLAGARRPPGEIRPLGFGGPRRRAPKERTRGLRRLYSRRPARKQRAEFPEHSRERRGRRTEPWRGVWERSGRAQRTREIYNVLG